MDLGLDPIDREDIIHRHGRRLFVLAYHLTGDSAKADELCQECLVRSLMAPDFPASEKETTVYLHRGLISLWRERAAIPARGPGPRTLGAATAPARRDHAVLWRSLARLDPVSRAVLVLRVAEGLEYETIGKVLDMAPDVVYARLLQARGGLREGERGLETSLFETMNLYLDGRLPGEQRTAFERRVQTESALRERVEFHRGLTLELHEEAPPLPRDFIARLREKMEKARETVALVDQAAVAAGWEPAPRIESAGRGAGPGLREREVGGAPHHRLSLWVAAVAAAIVLLAAGAGLGFWMSRRRPAPPPSGSEFAAGAAGGAASPEATPDEATIEALRSLGYLAPAKEKPREKPADPARATRGSNPGGKVTAGKKPVLPAPVPKKSPAPAPRVKATPAPSPASPPSAAATPGPPAAAPDANAPPAGSLVPAPAAAASPAPVEAATPVPPAPEATPPQTTSVAWRGIPLAKPLDPGRDRQTVRTAQEWSALFEGSGAPAPAVDFDKEMVVLVRSDPGTDPPARLVVAAVKTTPEAIVIECRSESPGQDAAPAAIAVVLPISQLPIRVVVR